MNASKLRRTLKSGGHVFGCMLSQMASTRFEQVLAGSTLDYAVIDSEHGSRDRTEIQNLTDNIVKFIFKFKHFRST